jgi:predicted Zn-dependent protease
MSMGSDPTLYDGRLSDGQTAAAIPVRARFGEAGLEILPAGERRTALVWPYGELRSNVPVTAGATDVVLSLKPNGSQTLFVANPAFSQALLARASGLSPARQRLLGLRPGIAAVAIVAAVVATVRFLELHPAQTIARMLPQQTREAMGRSVVAQLTGHMKQCESASGRIALDRLTSRLIAASGNATPVRVVMVDWALVNAFATPGGQIIMTRGLVQKAASPDEVAGVLAHEIGHTIELHPEAGLVRAMGLSAAAQLVFAGTTGTAANIGLLLTQLRYTRVAEREADGHAVRILKQAGISAKGFGDFFERLEPKLATPVAKTDDDKKDENKKKVSLGSRIFASEILRSHPLTADRLALVRAQPAYAATPALASEDWRALREMCGATVIAPRPAGPSAADQPTTAKPGPSTTTPAPPSPRPTAPAPTQQATDADRDIAEATKALDANPEDVAALQRRARAYSKKGQHAQAVADYTKAAQLRPADPSLHIGRGAAHYSLRQYELALVAYDEAIRLQPSNAVARNSRGNTNRALKRYQDALTDFDDLIRLRPDFVFAFYNRGLTNVDMGRPEDATRDFTAALGLDKDYAGAYTQRGLLHEKAGAREPAIADFRAAIAAPAAKYESGPWAQRVARERLRGLGVEVR